MLCILGYIFNYYLVCYFLYLLIKKVSIINSVIFLFELELKQFKISKILSIWKIDVYIVLIISIFKLQFIILIITLPVVFIY